MIHNYDNQAKYIRIHVSGLKALPVILPSLPLYFCPTKPAIWAPRLTPIIYIVLREAPAACEKTIENKTHTQLTRHQEIDLMFAFGWCSISNSVTLKNKWKLQTLFQFEILYWLHNVVTYKWL